MTERITNFSEETKEKLNHYVYRLVDPRTGQTFYVGQGKGDRVFDHIKAADTFYKKYKDEFNLQNDDDDDSTKLKNEDSNKKINELKQEDPAKLKKIKEIKESGLEVIHMIQRWGMSKETALDVEAAFIDFFDLNLLTNKQRGADSDRGMICADELERTFKRPCFEDYPNNPNHCKFMIIKINQPSIDFAGSVYEAVRRSWKINLKKAKQYPFVLAVKYGKVVGVYEVKEWKKNEDGDRAYFDGDKAPDEIWDFFFDKRIPERYRTRQNPISYCDSKMETKE